MKNLVYVIKISDERMCNLCLIMGAKGKKIVASESLLSEGDKAVYVLPPNIRINEKNIADFNDGSVVFCGTVEEAVKSQITDKNLKVFEFLKYGQFVCENAILTAKSALFNILKWEKSVYCDSKILLAGFGRVGRAVVEVLRPFYGKIDILTTHPENAIFYGNPILKSECDFGKYDLIISTVPEHIFGEVELECFSPSVYLMELASKPYSFDTELADRLKIYYQILPALPAKVLPRQAAQIMYEFIEKTEVDIC